MGSVNVMPEFTFFGKVLLVDIVDDACIVDNENDYKCKNKRALDPNSPQGLVISSVWDYCAGVDYFGFI